MVEQMARNGIGVKAASASSIEIEFQYLGERCRERIKCQPTPANLRRLAFFREEIIEAIAKGTFDYQQTFPGSQRFKTAPQPVDKPLDHWLNVLLDRSEKVVKASTYETLRLTCNALRPTFGVMLLQDIKRRHAREFCEKLTCGNRQIRKLIHALKSAIDCAVDDEVIDTNPLTNFKFVKPEPPKDDHVDPLTRDEMARILDVADGPFKNLVQFAVWTGLRTSELIALEWGDVDFVRGYARIARAKTTTARQAETTKTKAGLRDIKLLPPALEALASQKPHTFLIGKQVFLNGYKPYQGCIQIWNQWKHVLTKAGIRYRNPYQTRHTYASWLLAAGENISWISKQMGHSNIATTLGHYARYIPDKDDASGMKAVERFG